MESAPIVRRFERLVFGFLVVVLAAYVLVEMVELVYQFGRAVVSREGEQGRLLITKQQTQEVLPVFFSILIAVELIATMSMFASHHRVLVQSVLLIGLLAIVRKLLTQDVFHTDGWGNLGLAALIAALAGGYFLVGRSDRNSGASGDTRRPDGEH